MVETYSERLYRSQSKVACFLNIVLFKSFKESSRKYHLLELDFILDVKAINVNLERIEVNQMLVNWHLVLKDLNNVVIKFELEIFANPLETHISDFSLQNFPENVKLAVVNLEGKYVQLLKHDILIEVFQRRLCHSFCIFRVDKLVQRNF